MAQHAVAPSLNDILNKLMPVDAPAESSPRFVTKALSWAVPIYYMADKTTERQRKSVMTAMTLLGRSSDSKPRRWQTWVLTWSCMVFPELVSTISDSVSKADYVMVLLPESFVDECVEVVLAQGKPETAGEKFLTFPEHLPTGTLLPMTGHVAATVSSIEGLYAYYAMIVFILGKSISSDTIAAISTKRPDALIRKRQLYSSEYILKGDGRIDADNYPKIQGGWVRSTEPRILIVKHLATLYASPTKPESLDAIVVNMDMLRNAGQTYIFYVYELLVACDWCLEIPALSAAYRHFSRMVNILVRQPAHIQPFYKMMMQDATKDIRRREIENLVGVAIFYAAQTRKSMRQYRVSPECRPIIQAFIQKAAARNIEFSEISDQATIEATTV